MFDKIFDMVFIINLDERHDKWLKMVDRLNELGVKNYERISGIKRPLAEYPDNFYAGMAKKRISEGNVDKYLAGQSGCKLSHLMALELAKERKYKSVLILEDDCAFLPGAWEKFNRAISLLSSVHWDMFYLGGYHRSRRKAKYYKPGILQIQCTYLAHAYAVSSQSFDKIINILRASTSEVDVVYADQVHPTMNCFSIYPNIAVQEVGFSDIKLKISDHGKKKRHPFIERRFVTYFKRVFNKIINM